MFAGRGSDWVAAEAVGLEVAEVCPLQVSQVVTTVAPRRNRSAGNGQARDHAALDSAGAGGARRGSIGQLGPPVAGCAGGQPYGNLLVT